MQGDHKIFFTAYEALEIKPKFEREDIALGINIKECYIDNMIYVYK